MKLFVWLFLCSVASGQAYTVTIDETPERQYTPGIVAAPVYVPAPRPPAIVYQYQPTPAIAQTSSALGHANALRARRGLGPIRHDPRLQAIVNQKAQIQADRGFYGHPGGSMGVGRWEGVGMSSSPQTFTSCYLYSGGPAVGAAATARGANGRYYHCLILSSTPQPISKNATQRTLLRGPSQVRQRFPRFRKR